jgi:hypothetical protein
VSLNQEQDRTLAWSGVSTIVGPSISAAWFALCKAGPAESTRVRTVPLLVSALEYGFGVIMAGDADSWQRACSKVSDQNRCGCRRAGEDLLAGVGDLLFGKRL